MQPLGSLALLEAYHKRLTESHDYELTAEILDMEERPLAPAVLIDGQINLLADTSVRRTANVSLLDPDFGLGLDSEAPFAGALYADRMVRIRHYVDVPGFGTVVCTPIVGPIQDLNRDGVAVDLEVHDKTALAILGSAPYAVRKGMNAVAAIRAILADCCGERKFRLPVGTRMVLRNNYSVGWKDEASPWAVATRIARSIGMVLSYSCDGYATLRPRPTAEVFEFTALADEDGRANMTSRIRQGNPFADAVNYARATAGKLPPAVAVAPASHPLSPQNLGRNGVPRYLPSLADLDDPGEKPDRPGGKHRKASKAQQRKYLEELEDWREEVTATKEKLDATAASLLSTGLTQTTNYSCEAVPVFHLDVDDPVRLTVPEGSTVMPLATATIPLVSGDMIVGQNRRFKKPGAFRR